MPAYSALISASWFPYWDCFGVKALCHAIRADCLLMKQLGRMHSCDKFEFTNARHRLLFIQCCIFKSSIYVGIDVLVVSLKSVYPLHPFVLHCWMRNSIASVSECMIQLALLLTSSPHILSNLEPLPTVILTLLLSAVIDGPPGLALKAWYQHPERSNKNLSAACSITTYSHYTLCVPLLLYPL